VCAITVVASGGPSASAGSPATRNSGEAATPDGENAKPAEETATPGDEIGYGPVALSSATPLAYPGGLSFKLMLIVDFGTDGHCCYDRASDTTPLKLVAGARRADKGSQPSATTIRSRRSAAGPTRSPRVTSRRSARRTPRISRIRMRARSWTPPRRASIQAKFLVVLSTYIFYACHLRDVAAHSIAIGGI
jgi:hypothetical protein